MNLEHSDDADGTTPGPDGNDGAGADASPDAPSPSGTALARRAPADSAAHMDDAVVLDGVTVAGGRRSADEQVTEEAARLIAAAPAANTTRAYARIWAAYLSWCTATGRTPLPATGATLASFVAELAGRGLAPASIDQALACVSSAHGKAGLARPHTTAARDALRAYRRTWSTKPGNTVRKAPPITIDILRSLINHTPDDTPTGIRDRAALVLGFALMGRRSELAALDCDHLTFPRQGLEVFIPMSKTDQDAAGQTVAVPYGSHLFTCPVRSVQAWLAVLHEHGITTGALLRPIDRFDRIGGTPGWAGRGGLRLSGVTLNTIVKDAALRAGLADAERYSAHGLRAGGATTLADANVPTGKIAEQGRWKPTSPTVHGYVRAVDRWKDNPMGKAGL
ncbi:tyrosine-type recombinase/integrase [Streptosporangium sp. NBC_01639]|uniref:site-specific integrase n=1 Tax=Streptosporangium sp. NBC_01639 TaxID=2975948 RepID=UPI003868C551|nr:tyrosine-type recombinase/integrase [Streptosporangium sp. NBC_01639]